MKKKLTMEEKLRQKTVGYGKQADDSENTKTESKKQTEQNSSTVKNTSEQIKKLKEKINNTVPDKNKSGLILSKIKETINTLKDNGEIKRYMKLGIASTLLLAYVCGVFISLVSSSKRATLNPFKAIIYSLLNSTFYLFLFFILLISCTFVFIHKKINMPKDTDRIFGKSDALGSGGVATKEDMDKLLIMTDTLEEQPYIVFGKNSESHKWVGLNPEVDINHNFAVCGPQQSGKSFKYVKTNLTQLAKNEQSVIISDPKGEMYRDLSQFFRNEGYIVKQLNINDLYASDSWNVLKDVNEDNIDQFARTFVENLSDGKEQATFIDMKISLFKALCLYVLYEDKDLDEDERTLGRVYEMLATIASVEELDDIFLSLSDSSKAKQTYLTWAQGGRLKTNSLTTLGGKLQIFQRQALKEVTGTTDIDILLPAIEKCAYFIVLDDQNNTYSCIVSVFIKLIIEKAVWYAKRQANGKTDRRIHFLLEEFPTIGKIPDFKIGLGTWRGYGIDITVIFQNIPQLMNRYPDAVWNEILGACATQVCLGAYEDGDVTAEHYAKMGGTGTIALDSERVSVNKLNVLDIKRFTNTSQSENWQQAKAVYANEVKELILEEKMLVTIGGSKPFKFDKVGFNENKYYNTPKKPTYENEPLWLLKLKEKTNFQTEYGGVYKLGRLNEMPTYLLNKIDKWREEYFKGTGTFTSDETLPISYSDMKNVSEKMKTLNRKQGKALYSYIKKLANASTDEYASNVHTDVSEEITKNPSKKNQNTKPGSTLNENAGESEKKEDGSNKPVSNSNKGIPKIEFKVGNQKEDDDTENERKILTTGGKIYVDRKEKCDEDNKQQESKKVNEPLKFNVTFNKKN